MVSAPICGATATPKRSRRVERSSRAGVMAKEGIALSLTTRASGTAAEAMEAFLKEAREYEIQQVSEEWKRLRAHFAGRPLAESQAALVRLGIAWRPASEEELRRIDEILTRGKA